MKSLVRNIRDIIKRVAIHLCIVKLCSSLSKACHCNDGRCFSSIDSICPVLKRGNDPPSFLHRPNGEPPCQCLYELVVLQPLESPCEFLLFMASASVPKPPPRRPPKRRPLPTAVSTAPAGAACGCNCTKWCTERLVRNPPPFGSWAGESAGAVKALKNTEGLLPLLWLLHPLVSREHWYLD